MKIDAKTGNLFLIMLLIGIILGTINALGIYFMIDAYLGL